MSQYRLPDELDKVSPQQATATKAVVEHELDALDIVISEAEQKRRGEFYYDAYQRQRGYEELYRHGFGKTVVIDTEREGRLNFRVSQATSDYANTKLGFATPNSPLGHLCRSAKLGESRESPKWGEYTIVEIRNFSRFTGQEAAEHIRNFRVMESKSLILSEESTPFQATVANLRAALGRWLAKGDKPQVEASLPVGDADPTETAESKALAEIGIEFDFDFDEPALFADDDTEQENHYDIFGRSEQEQDDYYGLSNYFFLNPTDEQLEVMTNAVHAGPMLVEGVAGSGKTCAALGRAKTLCDLARSPDDEQFNSDFLAESSVGFVRTGELVQYLRASCLELDISQLPIEEYAGLVYQLGRARNLFIEQSKPASPLVTDVSEREDEEGDDEQLEARGEEVVAPAAAVKPKAKYHNLGTIPDYGFQDETRMLWLRVISAVIGWRIADDLQQQLDSLVIPDKLASDKFVSKPGNVEALLALVKSRLTALYQPLISQLREQSPAPFALDRVIHHIYQAQSQLGLELFDKHAKWVNPSAGEWRQVRDTKGAVDLLRKNGAAFVVCEIERNQMTMVEVMVEVKEDLLNLFKQGVEIRSAESMQLWQAGAAEELWAQLQSDDDSFNCRFPDGQPVPIKRARDFDDLNMRLITKKLFARISHRVFQVHEANPFWRQIQDGQKQTSLAKWFNAQLRRIYSKWHFADLYRDALLQPYGDDDRKAQSCVQSFSHWQAAAARLKDRLLAEHDKDLLLALAHIMTRELTQDAKVPAHLHVSPCYRSVFIDEVQDFTELQIFLMAEQADPKYHAVTLVGDMHQQLGRGNVHDIAACFPYRPLNRYLLKENKRQERMPQLAATAMLFRTLVQRDSRLADAGLVETWKHEAKTGGSKQFYDAQFDDVDHQLLDVLAVQPHGRTIAVVCPIQEMASELEARLRESLVTQTTRNSQVSDRIDLAKKYMVHFSCAEHVKGLEFDTVVYAGLEFIDWDDAHDLNKLYVTLSRPRKQLILFGDASLLPSHVHDCLVPESDWEMH